MSKSCSLDSSIVYLSAILSLITYYSPLTNAASYQSSTTSAIELGTAGAGAAADTSNLANIAVNPAITAAFEHPSIAIAAIFVTSEKDIEGESYSNGEPAALDQQGISDNYVVPSAYFAFPINDKWSFGFATFSNYNVRNNYDTRYPAGTITGQRSLFTYEINPNIAVKLTNKLYLGAGVSAIHGNYKLATNYGAQNPANPSQIYQDFQGTGLDFRYNIGVLYKINKRHQFGLSYRSATDIETEGDFTTLADNNDLLFQDSTTLSMAIPSETTLSGFHQLDPRLAIQYSLAWYGWENLDTISVAHPDCPANQDFNLSQGQCLTESVNATDSWKIAFAVSYKLNDVILLRSGASTEKSTESATFAIPFDERSSFSVGLTYFASRSLSFDMGLTYARYATTRIENTVALDSFSISAEGDSTMLGLQLNYQLIN
ncbi:OmpP1/FadL family transporter [Moritella sp. F3]|uniref:OmpP1/FadL family transporter n=1 Tax=Moritella sp. F3 TaxID=2718882 RepID=UPI0018E1B98D|nr:outer membrane protein transport protein [Moritella sp. F3]GIC75805.1 long-chain fatty acid outer membrane transporter [Moritella sp. F1]GIC81746.1 long-chain fatty acid outer membrane transporter [Moritella sp. F3]